MNACCDEFEGCKTFSSMDWATEISDFSEVGKIELRKPSRRRGCRSSSIAEFLRFTNEFRNRQTGTECEAVFAVSSGFQATKDSAFLWGEPIKKLMQLFSATTAWAVICSPYCVCWVCSFYHTVLPLDELYWIWKVSLEAQKFTLWAFFASSWVEYWFFLGQFFTFLCFKPQRTASAVISSPEVCSARTCLSLWKIKINCRSFEEATLSLNLVNVHGKIDATVDRETWWMFYHVSCT